MESDPRYAQLLSLMRAKPPSAEMPDVSHGLQLPPPSMSMGMGSMPPGGMYSINDRLIVICELIKYTSCLGHS